MIISIVIESEQRYEYLHLFSRCSTVQKRCFSGLHGYSNIFAQLSKFLTRTGSVR